MEGGAIENALTELLGRLGNLLSVLDDKLQTEGLFPDESAAREWVHQLVELDLVYKRLFEESLWDGLGDRIIGDLATQMVRTRDRLHSIEGERLILSALMREVGRLDRVVQTLCKGQGVEWPKGYDYDDANV